MIVAQANPRHPPKVTGWPIGRMRPCLTFVRSPPPRPRGAGEIPWRNACESFQPNLTALGQ
jgi:hypothetical protein